MANLGQPEPPAVGKPPQGHTNRAVGSGPIVDIVVPVLERPHHAATFVGSLRESTPDMRDVRVIAVPAQHDRPTVDAWDAAGADVLLWHGPRPGTFARKVNAAFRWTEGDGSGAPWLFLVGDDVRFHAGWLEAALEAARARPGICVVCPSAQTERVLGAGHAPHPMILREYVRRVGAGWDGPGVVAHEGYFHNFVDGEIAQAAQDRGVFTLAPASIVEHLHHLAHRAPVDRVYELGTSHLAHDRRIFDQRRTKFSTAEVG